MQSQSRHIGCSREFSQWTKYGPLEKEMEAHFSILASKLHGQYEKAKRYDTRGWSPRLEGVQYATWEEWRTFTNNTSKNEGLAWSRNDAQLWMCLVVKVKWCCKEQYVIGTWNVRSMNQHKLDVVKQEMARVNIYILRISDLKWMGMGKFNSDDHFIYNCGQESCRRNGIALIVNKKVRQFLGAISNTTEWPWFVSKANHSVSQ